MNVKQGDHYFRLYGGRLQNCYDFEDVSDPDNWDDTSFEFFHDLEGSLKALRSKGLEATSSSLISEVQLNREYEEGTNEYRNSLK